MGVKTLPTFLQSSPYISNSSSSDRFPSLRNETKDEAGTQGKRTTKFADVVAIISGSTSHMDKPSVDITSLSEIRSIKSPSNIGGSKNIETNIALEAEESSEHLQNSGSRRISTALSVKTCSVSQSCLNSFNWSEKSPQLPSSSIVSCMTDRQKRQLTRTILHPDELDMIIRAFNISKPEIRTQDGCDTEDLADDEISIETTNVRIFMADR
jgi:hypothetical protein